MALRYAHRAFTGGRPLPRAFAALNPVLPAPIKFLFEDVQFHTAPAAQQAYTPIGDDVYVAALRQFAERGDLTVKEAPVYLWRATPAEYDTLNAGAVSETMQKIGRMMGDRYLVFDPEYFDMGRIDDYLKLFSDRAERYERTMRRGDPDLHAAINSGMLTPRTVTSAIGTWTMKEGDRNADYESVPCKAGTCLYKPKQGPDNYRVCMQVDEDIVWHANWGPFYVPKGGTLIMRVGTRNEIRSQLAEIDAAPDDATRAALTEKYLFVTDEKSGRRLPKHDIWGAMPGFRKHYVNIEVDGPEAVMRKLPKADQSVLAL